MAHEKIVGVQYLRGIAVTAVVLDHGSAYAGSPFPRIEFGQHGVDLFFLISGFVIAAVSLTGPGLAPAIGARAFLWRRFVRIVPLMWVAIAGFVLASAIGIWAWPRVSFLTGVVLWPFGPITPSHLWTLRQEAIFYALFAATMLAGRRWRVLLVLWAISPSVVQILYHPIGRPPWGLVLSPTNWEFAAGLAAAVWWFRHSHACRIRMPVDPLLILAATSGAVLWGIVPALGIEAGPVMALLCLPVLLVAIHAECPPGRVRAFGELLGNASYSIYLVHLLGIAAALRLFAALAPGAPAWLVVASAALAGTVLGIAAHLLVERPLLDWLRRRFDPPAASPPAPQPTH